MPRHRKCRRICSMPQHGGFYPMNERDITNDEVVLTVDEYETVRLIDYEKLTQEQCALQMAVSRTTITGIYESARYKIADALTHGKKLLIIGGEFTLCEHNGQCCGQGCKHDCFKDGEEICKKEYCKKERE